MIFITSEVTVTTPSANLLWRNTRLRLVPCGTLSLEVRSNRCLSPTTNLQNPTKSTVLHVPDICKHFLSTISTFFHACELWSTRRKSNPHLCVRSALFYPLNYGLKMVRERGFQPRTRVPKTRMLALHYSLMVGIPGNDPGWAAFQTADFT